MTDCCCQVIACLFVCLFFLPTDLFLIFFLRLAFWCDSHKYRCKNISERKREFLREFQIAVECTHMNAIFKTCGEKFVEPVVNRYNHFLLS